MEDPALPNDVIIEILTWLPVQTLLKFRCVCKSWRTLVSSQQFVTAHLENSKLDRNFSTHRLLLEYRGNFKQCSVNSVRNDPVSEAFDLNFLASSDRVKIVGSCNGLVCLSIVRVKDLILWNPSTRIWRRLPDFGVKRNYKYSHFQCGFSFDESSDDYKVVGLFKSDLGSSDGIVKVYSLRNDRWRRVKNFLEPWWKIMDPATFANGKLYWVAHVDFFDWDDGEHEYFWRIVSFDLEKEEHQILQLPSYLKSCDYARLGASQGSLLAVCNSLRGADVWMMDGGCLGGERWTKVVTMPCIVRILEFDKKVLYEENGLVLFILDERYTFVIFDAKDCSVHYPVIRNLGQQYALDTYVESLVSPLG